MANVTIKKRGFTLLEILITVGLVTIVGSVASFIEINSFRGDAFRSEVSTIGTALQTARANSFNNINQKIHGVAFNPGGSKTYIIFEGNTFATRDTSKDIVLNSSYDLEFSPLAPTEVTFSQLSGDASYNGAITVLDTTRGMSAEININYEGKIAW